MRKARPRRDGGLAAARARRRREQRAAVLAPRDERVERRDQTGYRHEWQSAWQKASPSTRRPARRRRRRASSAASSPAAACIHVAETTKATTERGVHHRDRPFCELRSPAPRGDECLRRGPRAPHGDGAERADGEAVDHRVRVQAAARKRALGHHQERRRRHGKERHEKPAPPRRVAGEVGHGQAQREQEGRLERDEAQPHTRPRDAAERKGPERSVERLSFRASAATVKRPAPRRRSPSSRASRAEETPSRRLPPAHPRRRFEPRRSCEAVQRDCYIPPRVPPRKLPGGRSLGRGRGTRRSPRRRPARRTRRRRVRLPGPSVPLRPRAARRRIVCRSYDATDTR